MPPLWATSKAKLDNAGNADTAGYTLLQNGSIKRLTSGSGIAVADSDTSLQLSFSPAQGSGQQLWTGTKLRALGAGAGVTLSQTDDLLTISAGLLAKTAAAGDVSLVDAGAVRNVSGTNGISVQPTSTSAQFAFNPTQGAGQQLWTGAKLRALSAGTGVTLSQTDDLITISAGLLTKALAVGDVSLVSGGKLVNVSGGNGITVTPTSTGVQFDLAPQQSGGTPLWDPKGFLRGISGTQGITVVEGETLQISGSGL
jgi:hypothetical protein